MKTVHLIITGRVQGVYFRAFTQKQAVKYGVKGYVCNKENGAVEVVATARQEQLEPFVSWCHKGHMLAKVDNVVQSDYSITEVFTQFEIR